MKFEVRESRGKSGHSEVVSAQAETAERQAPCTADEPVPNFLCRERGPRPACRVRAFATAISGWHKTTSTLSLTIALVVGLPRSTPQKREPLEAALSVWWAVLLLTGGGKRNRFQSSNHR